MKYTLSSFTVKQENVKPAKRALAELVAEIRQNEPRTLYLGFREDGTSTFFTLMAFEDEAAERRHAQSRHVGHFAKKLLPLCDGKPYFTELSYFAGSKKQWLLDRGNLPNLLAPLANSLSRRGNGASLRRAAKGRTVTPVC
jgi:quinol monooxygenase YgiN